MSPLRKCHLQETHAAIFERFPFLPQKYQWAFKDYFHDFIVSWQLPAGDLFHGWNGHCLRSLSVAKKKGAVTVVERASSHPNTYERLLKEEYARWGLRVEPILPWVKRRLLEELETADYITTPSDFAYQSMLENGVPEGKLIKIPFGADVPNIKDQISNIKNTSQKSKGSRFAALFVGQVGIRKGVPYLLEAWRKLGLKDAELYLLGEVEKAVEKIIAPYRSFPSIHFVGYADPRSYYEKADIFVFPSIEEGSALVTYEALAAGLPVITTFNAGSVVEDGGEGFIITAGSTSAIAERVKELYENPSLLVRMRANAVAKGRFCTWEKYGDNLAKAYVNILGGV